MLSGGSDDHIMVQLETSEFRRQVASTELFGALEGDALDDLMGRLIYARVPAGETVFRHGDSLYIVLNGPGQAVKSRLPARPRYGAWVATALRACPSLVMAC